MVVTVVVVVVVSCTVGRCSGGGSGSSSRRIAGRIAAVAVARLLPLAVLLILHATVLEPDFDLALRQVEIARQLPAFLFRHVGVEEKLFLQFERLEL